MGQKKQQFLENIQKALLLSLLVIASNLFLEIELFGDTELLFGSTFVILSLQLIPFRYASLVFIACLLSMHQTNQLWQELVMVTLEFFAIAYLIHRRLLLIVASAIFWLFFGAPFLWILLQFGETGLKDISILLTIHTTLNSVLNAAIAASLLVIIPNSLQNQNIVGKQNRLASNIFALCASTLMVPLLLVSFVYTGDSAKEFEKLTSEDLSSKASFISQLTQSFLKEHELIIRQQADLISLNTPDYLVYQSMIVAQKRNPAFYNITSTDENGQFLLFAPEKFKQDLDNLSEEQKTVADRQYFLEAKRTERIFISNTIMSRGLIQGPMLSIAAPYFDNSAFKGIVFGAINLNAISDFRTKIENLLDDSSAIVTDKNGFVVFTTVDIQLPPISNFIPVTTYNLASKNLQSTMVNNMSYVYERENNSYGWRVYVLSDANTMMSHLEHVYYLVGISLILVLSIFLIFAYNLSSKITEPLVALLNSDGESKQTNKPLISISKEFDDVELKLKHSKFLVQNFENRLKQQVTEKTTQLEQLNLQLAAQAREDGLTHLLNRTGFDELAVNAIKTNYRLEQPFSLALLDIDHFKQINDNYGHPFGDKCLRAFSALLQRNCKRDTDIIGRYGGEEFIILMSGKNIDVHHQIIQNIHQQTMGLQQKVPNSNTNVSFTVSIGICSVLGNVNLSLYDIVKLADEELYKCKRGGRNRIAIRTYGYSPENPK
ncbi:sensor domain-containing diguanylate cyclase [Glaciecola sp. 1036]|uniref:sensor domain-containing diguanylate cyclase n=1 Tax=Alteromonadaceae TaxID=72275 RepID=UPI003CFDF8C7